jgi:hypothetical protein
MPKLLAKSLAVLGLVIPLVLLFTDHLLRSHPTTYNAIVGSLQIVFLLCWPTSIWLMATNSWSPSAVVILVLSIAANVLLYWLAGLLIGRIFRIFVPNKNRPHAQRSGESSTG